MRSSESQKKFAEPTEVLLHKVDIYDHPGFKFTTPTTLQRTVPAGERRKIGCVEKLKTVHCFRSEKGVKCSALEEVVEEQAGGKKIFTRIVKQFTGERCPPGEGSDCAEDNQVYDERCQDRQRPCDANRATCPVQLVWVKGKPNLRFCRQVGKHGYLVPVRYVKEAMEISGKACAKWAYRTQAIKQDREWDPEFFNRNAPEVVKRAKAGYPEQGGLGGVDDDCHIRPARYAKGKIAVTCRSADGFKNRGQRLAVTLSGNRYTGRENAYVMSPSQAELFRKLYDSGWDAALMSQYLYNPQREKQSVKDARKLFKKGELGGVPGSSAWAGIGVVLGVAAAVMLGRR